MSINPGAIDLDHWVTFSENLCIFCTAPNLPAFERLSFYDKKTANQLRKKREEGIKSQLTFVSLSFLLDPLVMRTDFTLSVGRRSASDS